MAPDAFALVRRSQAAERDARVLVRRAQAGERDALAHLFERHQAHVYSLAVSMMRNPTDAADMTQDTFLRLLRSLHTFRGDTASFSTWLHRLTINVCLDALRRRRRLAGQTSLEAVNVSESHESSMQPEAWTVRHESAAEVRAAMMELPLPQRVALTLHYFGDRSCEQIASTMGVPINTVKSHIARGRERMARLLSQRSRGPLVDPVLATTSPRRNPTLVLVAA